MLTQWTILPIYNLAKKDEEVPDGVLMVGQVKNGKTRILEKTAAGMGHGYAAIYVHNPAEEEGSNRPFQLISSVFHEDENEVTEVDIEPTKGLKELLSATLADGEDHYTASAVVKGKDHLMACTALPAEEQFSLSQGSLRLATAKPMEAYYVYAIPSDTMASIGRQQILWVSLCMGVQVLILLVMTYMGYKPYRELMEALVTRGLIKRSDIPSLSRIFIRGAKGVANNLLSPTSSSKRRRRPAMVAPSGSQVLA